jgi:hypothetical protein
MHAKENFFNKIIESNLIGTCLIIQLQHLKKIFFNYFDKRISKKKKKLSIRLN